MKKTPSSPPAKPTTITTSPHSSKKCLSIPREKTALEIGCGIGRIARWMSQDFAQYIGVDVSPEMIRKASSYNLPRAHFQAVSGGDLAGIPNASVDFVWSFAVFQHVPDKHAIFNYFQEAARVLRPGGIFRLHMKGLWTLPLGRLMLEAGFPDRYRDRDKKRQDSESRSSACAIWIPGKAAPSVPLKLCNNVNQRASRCSTPPASGRP